MTVTKPGSFGMVKNFTVRANKRPTITDDLPEAELEDRPRRLHER